MNYVQTYIDLLNNTGYEDTDKAAGLFENYYDEYIRNPVLRPKANARKLRFELLCASIATLKTNGYLGVENEDLYDIKSIWRLTDREYKLVAETLVDNLEKYHLDGTGVPTRDDMLIEQYEYRPAYNPVNSPDRSRKNMKGVFLILDVILVILVVIFGISTYFCKQEIDCQKVDVYVDNCYPAENHSLKVTVRYDWKPYQLEGVTKDDERYYGHARYAEETVPAYLYNGKMYATEDAMQRARPCFTVRLIALGSIGFDLILLVVFLAVYSNSRYD